MFEFIKKLFRSKESMVEDISKKELEYIIQNHLVSDSLKNMKTADAYYIGKHDILKGKYMDYLETMKKQSLKMCQIIR